MTASVLLSLVQRRHVVLQQVLSEVASLCERLSAKLADEGSFSVMHAEVVEQVPCSEELLLAAIEAALVNDDHFVTLGVSSVL